MIEGMLPQTVTPSEPLPAKVKAKGNQLAKTRPIDQPYMVFRANGWEWRVLKAYKGRESESKDMYARWFLGTKSPFTYGEFELGDGYVRDVVGQAECVELSDVAAMAGYKLGWQRQG